MDDRDSATSSSWPKILEKGRVGDAAFAAAYARIGDRERAWIKTGLAALYAACGGPWPLGDSRDSLLGHDLRFSRREAPLDFVLVACAAPFASPARLAAAVLPALCARVPAVAAVRVGEAWPRPLLTTLELCGLETVFRVGTRTFAGLGRELAGLGQGTLVLLDGLAAPRDLPPALRIVRLRTAGTIGVFPEAGADFDWEALAFAQPDLTVRVHGGACPEQESFVAAQGTLAEAAQLGYDAVYVAEARLDAGLAAAPLALGPGRETLWLWPEISPRTFRRRRLAAGVQGEQSA
jgi:hypothetical protein